MINKIITCGLLALLLWSCSDEQQPIVPVSKHNDGRWYSQAQVAQGQSLFAQNCARCHGDNAEGLAADWRKPTAEGFYPPPPLNGTAHAWHHKMSALKFTIREGGVKLGGQMPGFGDTLGEQEQEAIIAFIQSFWTDEIYNAWIDRGGLEQ